MIYVQSIIYNHIQIFYKNLIRIHMPPTVHPEFAFSFMIIIQQSEQMAITNAGFHFIIYPSW